MNIHNSYAAHPTHSDLAAAEELDLPLARVEMVSGDTARTPDEG